MRVLDVSKPQYEILTSTKPLNLFLAGAGSGKTFNMGLLSAEFVVNYPQAIGLIAANTYEQLTKSTLKSIFENWLNTFGWVNGVHYVVDKIPPKHFKVFGAPLKTYHNTISFNNGATIFTASLENYSVIDGTELGWALLDETKDTREEALKDVIVWRLRQKCMYITPNGKLTIDYIPNVGYKGFNPLYIFTSPAKVEWINEWFGLSTRYEEISQKIFSQTDFYTHETETHKVVICSTWHNKKNLPDGYIEGMIQKFTGNQDKIDMLIYGSPIAKSGGEFFSHFNRLKHVQKVDFIKEANIHISLDFNVVPYITMTCWQIIKKNDGSYQARCFDEICLDSPKNNTEALCLEFKNKWLSDNDKRNVFYYGDASGKNASTVSKEHNYDILERVLNKYLNDSSNRVLTRNPSVVRTRDFMNKIFAGGLPIEILINEKCQHLIRDFEFLKEAPDGGKLITKATDKITGQSFEKYGHTSDSARYLIVSAFNGLFEAESVN